MWQYESLGPVLKVSEKKVQGHGPESCWPTVRHSLDITRCFMVLTEDNDSMPRGSPGTCGPSIRALEEYKDALGQVEREASDAVDSMAEVTERSRIQHIKKALL